MPDRLERDGDVRRKVAPHQIRQQQMDQRLVLEPLEPYPARRLKDRRDLVTLELDRQHLVVSQPVFGFEFSGEHFDETRVLHVPRAEHRLLVQVLEHLGDDL